MNLTETLAAARVLPVITPGDEATTVRLAQALSQGGMNAIEITLRSDSALDCLRAVKEALPQMTLAAGTVVRAEDVLSAADAGADICVSPGLSAALLEAAAAANMPLLPGVATPSEIMLGMAHGIGIFKLFPAVAVGGMPLLKALAGPFPKIQFCPTGGLTAGNFREFLALPNVLCCGGSWMAPEALINDGAWAEIEALARYAMQPEAA